MRDNGSDDEEDFDSPTNMKKRKFGNGKGPKIEDADEKGCFPGMGEEEDNGDAIDFSVGYTGNFKTENAGNEAERGIVDLTEDVEVKKEVVEGNENDDEMAI